MTLSYETITHTFNYVGKNFLTIRYRWFRPIFVWVYEIPNRYGEDSDIGRLRIRIYVISSRFTSIVVQDLIPLQSFRGSHVLTLSDSKSPSTFTTRTWNVSELPRTKKFKTRDPRRERSVIRTGVIVVQNIVDFTCDNFYWGPTVDERTTSPVTVTEHGRWRSLVTGLVNPDGRGFEGFSI